MMLFLGAPTWWRLFWWTLIGVVIYLGYGRRHSKVGAAAVGSAPR
jgi:APA family basic amino acid/polyamine antiporter